MSFDTLEVWGAGGPLATPLTLFRGGTSLFHRTTICTPESRTLQNSKAEITGFYEEGKWDDYKKITNPFEYVFLSWNRRSSYSVATRQPLSRSYFKMIELWKRIGLTEHLRPLVAATGGLVTAHSAEGPGGFIEACVYSAQRNDWAFQSATAITLRSDAKNVPGWRKAAKFLTTFPSVEIHDGADGTGNILLPGNQDSFVSAVRTKHPEGVHLYTADGGFDFSSDYDGQEDSVFPLLLAETILGLRVLAKGGCLIIKCFDTTEHATVDLIWLISRAFCQWGLVKPRTSRGGNAERYIIGAGFLGGVDDILALMHAYPKKPIGFPPVLETPTCPSYKSVRESIITLQESIEHNEIIVIRETLELIKKTESATIKRLVRDNVLRSIQWCKEHGEDIAMCWLTDFEKNVAKETVDLLHLLNPASNMMTYTGGGGAGRTSTLTNYLSFEGFRTGLIVTNPAANPFMRVKKL